ncbi:hypothetical protein H310_06995 [Aphanomyces invadans]|uniref:RGS domain-containing protein n=1 Tax=Aphanomyces invadans TaxID=157072 RepID=A0A024U390_9STRA|nr:hypothetical protein H310_06995 [Aphanomyces invadans]ETW00347.1 hypothetical protein H310_06995 [Aphanomyces invadans]|eukprot:XP_008870482.1 hypothetical protein H310_06995 [Aphanomyces invadans]
MGSFPSTSQLSKRGSTTEDRVQSHRPSVKAPGPNQNLTRLGSVCYEHLKGIPLATLLESSVGCKYFTALCSKINRDDVIQLYLALQGIRAAPDSTTTGSVNKTLIDTNLRRVASTTRLSNKSIANLRITLNNLSKTTSAPPDIQDVIREISATLTEQEYQYWLVSQEGRDFIGESARFDHLLHDHIAMCYFHLFLVQEYSSENLEFIESVLRYEADWIHSDVETTRQLSNVQHAKHIVTLFVEENAPLQINVPSKIRIRLERKVLKDGEAPKDIFRIAKSEISSLIQRDSWPRFTKSTWWSTYLNYDVSDPTVAAVPALTRRQQIYIQFIGDDDLTKILSSDLGREHLRIFLAFLTEGNTVDGSVEFLRSAQQYLNNKVENDRAKLAQQLFDTHLAENAPLPALHVSSDVTASVKSNLATQNFHGIQTDFAKAVELTEAFVTSHALPKFKLNGLYAKYRILTQQKLRLEDGHVGMSSRKSSLVL